jgi:hypothetical protein
MKKSGKRNMQTQDHKSFHRHQRQKFWQILFPLILIGSIVLALVVMMILSVVGVPLGIDLRQSADVALIWVLIPNILLGFVFAMLLFALVFLIFRLVKFLPRLTSVLQDKTSAATSKTGQISNKLVQPLIKIKSIKAGAKAFFNAIKGRSKPKTDLE